MQSIGVNLCVAFDRIDRNRNSSKSCFNVKSQVPVYALSGVREGKKKGKKRGKKKEEEDAVPGVNGD